MAVAEPIAAAMSALHSVEASGGASRLQAGPVALNAARQALAMLQQQPQGYAAVDQALEAIAGSLNLIHQLAQAPAAQPQAAFAGTVAAPPTQPSPQGWGQQPPPQQGYQQPPQQAYQQPPQQAYQQPPQQAYQQPPQQAYQQPPQQAAPAFPQHAAPAAAAPAAGGPVRIEAELGAHSTTNFYKGLSGNDVIDSGGIFVATYQIPKIGSQVLVKVSMPGGYEFEALGIVRWTREATGGSDSSPGFGAQFTQISPEGRQLVYRYVRNREPLFHDDL
jgi:hypothetical protein